MSVFSDRLKSLRGSTPQSQFAAELGMKQQQYARYETGVTVPGADILATICRVHACSADWLLGIDRPPSSSVAVRGSAVSPGRQPTTNSPTRNSPTTNYQPPTTKSAPGTLPQCARCEHRKLAEKMRKMLGGG